MATFVGKVSVLSLIAVLGAATTAKISTARKAVTLLLSYLIFTKPLTEQHVTGLLIINMGIMMNILPDNKPPSVPSRSGTTNMKLDKGSTKGDGGQLFSDVKGGDEEETTPLV